jgi:hypothetical protein
MKRRLDRCRGKRPARENEQKAERDDDDRLGDARKPPRQPRRHWSGSASASEGAEIDRGARHAKARPSDT